MSINRRQFVGATGVLLGAGLLAGRGQAAAEPGQPSRAARNLYRRAVVVDGNLGPEFDDNLPLPEASLAAYRDCGLTAIKTTLGGFNSDFESTLAEIGFFLRVLERHGDVFMQVRHAADFAAAKRAGRIGIIFSFEGVNMLDGQLERIQLFRDLGVRVMQLSYNTTSPFASGVLASPPSGLTDLGRAAVQKMNELGVAVDLSHANPQTTADAIALSKRPVLITHAGCTAVHEHPRNKTDAQLRAIAGKGGVVGIYDLPYLTPSPRQPTLEDYLAHMGHALTICGEDHVGIGSDTSFGAFDTSPESMAEFNRAVAERKARGVGAPGEDRPPYVEGLNTSSRCEIIADGLLAKGYPGRVAEKVLGANFVRAFGEIWQA
jgi:membrane dipeptidase